MKLFKQLHDSNLALLSKETGLTEEEIMTSNSEDAVDCRYMLIRIAKEYKVSNTKISKFSGFTLAMVGRLSQQDYRLDKFSVRLLMKKIRENTEELTKEYQN